MTDDVSPRSRFGLRFSLLACRWRQALDAHPAAAGLSDATWIPLVHLHETGGAITQKTLAAPIGSAHVLTPVTNAHGVYRLQLQTKKAATRQNTTTQAT